MNIQAGQTVYLKPGINTTRFFGNGIKEGVIKSVGRKYITVSTERCDYQFNKDGLWQNTNYSPDYYLYFDKQQIFDEAEKNQILKEVQAVVRYESPSRLTLDQLRRIKAIMNETE